MKAVISKIISPIENPFAKFVLPNFLRNIGTGLFLWIQNSQAPCSDLIFSKNRPIRIAITTERLVKASLLSRGTFMDF